MAEAAVEERPPNPRFFCHKCSVEFENASPEYTCPHCLGGFIEELEENNEGSDDMIDVEQDDLPMNADWPTDLNTFLVEVDRRNSRARIVNDPTRRRRITTRISTGSRHQIPFENMIQDFILNLGWGGQNPLPGNMLLLGNPGDYAWGREGLDAIVTQLLNQLDGTGPPPLSKEVIDQIPTVAINQEQVDAKVQCSVCWEDFILNENVRKLPCAHVYHENCICPWLELHGTCPICRQSLVPPGSEQHQQQQQQQQQSNTNSRNNANNAGNFASLEDFIHAVNNFPGSSNSSSSSSSVYGAAVSSDSGSGSTSSSSSGVPSSASSSSSTSSSSSSSDRYTTGSSSSDLDFN